VRQAVEIVDVSLRDGLQSLPSFVPTEQKIALLQNLCHAGLRRIEATSFVSQTALPQFSDASEILSAAKAIGGLIAQVLVPTARHAERALKSGADHLAFVLSVSESHNRSNVRRSPVESIAEFRLIAAMLPASENQSLRVSLATAFDCPFDGSVDSDATLRLLEQLVQVAPDAEIALSDTTGRAPPTRVRSLFEVAREKFGQCGGWAFHGHDTYGLGTANAYAAWTAGVNVFDASTAGLGGCPFAPNATGNVATEDVAWMFEAMGVSTGIDLTKLLGIATELGAIPGAQIGGRVRLALETRGAGPCPAAA